VGATGLGKQVEETIKHTAWMGLRVIGYFDDRRLAPGRTSVGDIELGGNLRALTELARKGEVDYVYIVLPLRAEKRIKELMNRMSDSTVSLFFVPDFSSFDLLGARWDTLGSIPVLSVVHSPFHGTNGLFKRAMDVCLSLAILSAVALPMLLIAAAIKVTSKGPVIFRQRRYGLDGKEFEIWKFRTMAVCEDGNQFRQATTNDPRVTHLGAFLRRTSLDELPQFINVLQGRMSIVGPRPHPVAMNEKQRTQINGYMWRHKVKPGITGWAQVNGYRGETDTPDKLEGRIRLDLEYIDNWSLWLDLRIILRTIRLVFDDPAAY
jgi:putative colanic acid biosynthesis UDP-glucose lipid carrier transferase